MLTSIVYHFAYDCTYLFSRLLSHNKLSFSFVFDFWLITDLIFYIFHIKEKTLRKYYDNSRINKILMRVNLQLKLLRIWLDRPNKLYVIINFVYYYLYLIYYSQYARKVSSSRWYLDNFDVSVGREDLCFS